MSIGVQNTSAAMLALQTLGRLNDTTQSGQAGQTGQAGSSTDSQASVVTSASISSLGSDGLSAASSNLDKASSIIDTAISGGTTVGDLLAQMKTLAGQVQDGSTSGSDASSGFADLLQQLKSAISGASFDGTNLLDGSTGAQVTVGAGTGGQVTLNAENLSLGGSIVTLSASATMSTASSAANVMDSIDSSLANLSKALDDLGGQSRQITAHSAFVSRLSDVLSLTGTSTPDSADSAKLMALNVQQQLQLQGGGIANANSNVLLTLFK